MGNFGFRISEEGQDVKTCDDKECVFTSNANTVKLISGASTITLNNGAGFASATLVTHSLGYRPYAQVFPNYFSKRYNATNFITTEADFPAVFAGTDISAFSWTDISTTTITLNIDLNGDTANGAQTFNVFYYYALDTAQI